MVAAETEPEPPVILISNENHGMDMYDDDEMDELLANYDNSKDLNTTDSTVIEVPQYVSSKVTKQKERKKYNLRKTKKVHRS